MPMEMSVIARPGTEAVMACVKAAMPMGSNHAKRGCPLSTPASSMGIPMSPSAHRKNQATSQPLRGPGSTSASTASAAVHSSAGGITTTKGATNAARSNAPTPKRAKVMSPARNAMPARTCRYAVWASTLPARYARADWGVAARIAPTRRSASRWTEPATR